MAETTHLLGLPRKHKPKDIEPQGAGSGLDADMLDGKHLSQLQQVGLAIPTVNVSYVEFNNLDINADRLYLLYVVIKNTSAATMAYRIFVNDDKVLTNYYQQYFNVSGGALGYGRVNNSDLLFIGGGERNFTWCGVMLDPDGYFRYISHSSRWTGSSVQLEIRGGSKTGTVANITKITIEAQYGGGIGANSIFLLLRGRII